MSIELLERARLYRTSGDPATAARILADMPESASVLEELAIAHYRSAALTKAETATRRLLELDPAHAYAHLLLGRTLMRQSRHDEARPHLRLAAAMTGDPEIEALLGD